MKINELQALVDAATAILPKPWEVDTGTNADPSGDGLSITSDGWYIATLCDAAGNHATDESKLASAAAIAALHNNAKALLYCAAELAHLVRLLEPLERDGSLQVPGLATLNGARKALAQLEGRS